MKKVIYPHPLPLTSALMSLNFFDDVLCKWDNPSNFFIPKLYPLATKYEEPRVESLISLKRKSFEDIFSEEVSSKLR